MLPFLKQAGENLLHLVFPPLCISCFEEHHARDSIFCVKCLVQLPFTNYHLHDDHELIKRFYGRMELTKALAIFHFYEDSHVQTMLHKIKYRDRPDIAEKLGIAYGKKLKFHKVLSDADMIIPIPLHPTRFGKRGYNQSYHFAKGLSISMKISLGTKLIKRIRNTESQTKKTTDQRRKNVDGAFNLKRKSLQNIRHIVIVDDVITTGATIESCASLFKDFEEIKISICCIASPKFGI